MLISGHQFIDLFFTCPNMQITSFLVRLIWTKLLGSLKSHTKKKKEGCVSSLLQSYRYHHSSKHFKNSADGVTSLTPIWPQPNRIETSRTKQKKKKIHLRCVCEWMNDRTATIDAEPNHTPVSLVVHSLYTITASHLVPTATHFIYTHFVFRSALIVHRCSCTWAHMLGCRGCRRRAST